MPALLPPGTSHGNVDFYNNLAMAAFLVGGRGRRPGLRHAQRPHRPRADHDVHDPLLLGVHLPVGLLAGLVAHGRAAVLRGHGRRRRMGRGQRHGGRGLPQRARSMSLGIFHGSSILGRLGGRGRRGLDRARLGIWRWAFGVGLLPALLTIWIYASLHEPEQWVQARALAAVDRSGRRAACSTCSSPICLRPTLVGLALATVGLATFWGVYVRGQRLMRELAENARIGPAVSQLDPKQRRPAPRRPSPTPARSRLKHDRDAGHAG